MSKKVSKKVLTKLLVDRSGSMASCLADAQGGYDTFIEERKAQNGVKEYASLTEFDTDFDLVYGFTKVKDIPVKDDEGAYRLQPRGMTAFHDAVVKVITEVDGRAEATDKNVEKVFVIVTDGFENSSREYPGEAGREKVRKLISDRQEKGWVFIYLGANMDAVQTASTYGIPVNTSLTYDTTVSGAATTSASSMMSRGISGQGYSFTSAERTASAGPNTNTHWVSNTTGTNTVPPLQVGKIDWDDEQE